MAQRIRNQLIGGTSERVDKLEGCLPASYSYRPFEGISENYTN